MMSSSSQLKGKTVLITGCNRGIGRAMVELFIREGASIVACIRKKNPDFECVMESLAAEYGTTFRTLYFDMVNEEEVKNTLSGFLKEKVPVDVLVNNAGVIRGGHLGMTPMELIKEVFQVNFFSHVLVTQIVSRWMMRNKRGSIINMGSVAGLDNFAGETAYGGSKAAMMLFTKTLARELAPYGIRVNAIAPGMTATDMSNQLDEGALKVYLANRVDLNRLAKPEEIAEVALFLASDRSSFVTGQVIRADGGM